MLWEEHARLFAYSCGSDRIHDRIDDNELENTAIESPNSYRFRHRHSSLMGSIYSSRQTLEEHDGMFQAVMTTMARSNLFSKSTISSRSESGFRLSFFRSTNGASYLQAASFLALQVLPTWSTAIVLKMGSMRYVSKAMVSSSGAPRQTTVTAPLRPASSLMEIFSNPFYLLSLFTHL